MIFETIHDILHGSQQPWRKDNALSDSIYRERLMTIDEDEMPADISFVVSFKPELMFSSRIRYYCRIVNNEIIHHLQDISSKLSNDDNGELTSYYWKMTRETIITLVHDAVDREQMFPVNANTLVQECADFMNQRAEKEYAVILRFIVASLCHCYMEMQNRYKDAINPIDLYDVPTFYASVAGWSTDLLFQIKPIDADNISKKLSPKAKTKGKRLVKNKTNTFTESTFTCDSLLNEDSEIAEKRMALFCDSLLCDFVNAKDKDKAKVRRIVEKLFTGKLLKENEQLVWKAAKKELVYFFRLLKKHLKYSSKENFWNIVASHFIIQTQGLRKVRSVPISADSLKSTTENPQQDIVKKLEWLVKLLTSPIGEVLQQYSTDKEEDAQDARYQQMAEKDYIKELYSSKQKP